MGSDDHGRRVDLERSNDGGFGLIVIEGSRSPRSFLLMYENKYKKHPQSRTYTYKYE